MMAFIPRGSKVFRADRRLMERLGVSSGMEVEERDVGIKAVHGLRICDAHLRQPSGAVSPQLSQIHVKRTIFLQHEEDVFDGACCRG